MSGKQCDRCWDCRNQLKSQWWQSARGVHSLLGKYVHRYFDDIKLHLQSLRKVVTPNARCFYIVGNSKFYDTMLPVEKIYAALFEDAGFRNVGWKAIRKRNKNKRTVRVRRQCGRAMRI